MRHILALLILVAASVSQGTTFTVGAQKSIVPTAIGAFEMTRSPQGSAYKNQLGYVLREAHGVAVGVWDYARTGGAAGDHAVGIDLPAKAIVKKVFFDVVTTPVGVSSTIAFKVSGAGDLKTATATGTWTGMVDGALDGAVANFIKLSTAKSVYATIASAYSAGKIKVFVSYSVSE